MYYVNGDPYLKKSLEKVKNIICDMIFLRIYILPIFRPPFINGRPQDSDSVFGKKRDFPLFLVTFPLVFSFAGATGGDRGALGYHWVTAGPKNIFGDMGL